MTLWTEHGWWRWRYLKCGNRHIRHVNGAEWSASKWQIRFDVGMEFTPWQPLMYGDDSPESEREAKRLALATELGICESCGHEDPVYERPLVP